MKFRQNHLYYRWNFLCLCDLCKNNQCNTDEAFELLVQEADMHAKRHTIGQGNFLRGIDKKKR